MKCILWQFDAQPSLWSVRHEAYVAPSARYLCTSKTPRPCIVCSPQQRGEHAAAERLACQRVVLDGYFARNVLVINTSRDASKRSLSTPQSLHLGASEWKAGSGDQGRRPDCQLRHAAPFSPRACHQVRTRRLMWGRDVKAS